MLQTVLTVVALAVIPAVALWAGLPSRRPRPCRRCRGTGKTYRQTAARDWTVQDCQRFGGGK